MIRVVGGAACHRAPISGRRGEGLLSDSGGRQARAGGWGGCNSRYKVFRYDANIFNPNQIPTS